MRKAAPPISDLRLNRFHRLALLWLTWFATFLTEAAAFAPISAQARAAAHQVLDKIESVILSVAILRASRSVRRTTPRKRVFKGRINSSGWRRAMLGSGLRHALRPQDPHARIAALRAVSIAALAAAILRRMPTGMSRRLGIAARPEAQLIAPFSAFIAAACAHDSS